MKIASSKRRLSGHHRLYHNDRLKVCIFFFIVSNSNFDFDKLLTPKYLCIPIISYNTPITKTCKISRKNPKCHLERWPRPHSPASSPSHPTTIGRIQKKTPVFSEHHNVLLATYLSNKVHRETKYFDISISYCKHVRFSSHG